MRTGYLAAVIGLSVGLASTIGVSAQVLRQVPPQATIIKYGTVSIKAQMDRRARLMLVQHAPDIRDDDTAGAYFTDSSMLGVTRAGTFGSETGTMDSDVNGQIGTTDQNDMVNGQTNIGIFTSHFGPTASSRSAHKRALPVKTKTTAERTKPQMPKPEPTNSATTRLTSQVSQNSQ